MSGSAPEMELWVRVGLLVFIALMVAAIVVYHRWLDRRRATAPAVAPHGEEPAALGMAGPAGDAGTRAGGGPARPAGS